MPPQPAAAARLRRAQAGRHSAAAARADPAVAPPPRSSCSPGRRRRGDAVVTRVIPMLQGDASQQLPPDLPSYLFKERIVYLGMSLVPSVTELILAELLYLQFEDAAKPIYMYINSTGTTKDGKKLGYDTEAFAIYDTLRRVSRGYVKPPVHTVCVGTAFGEAAMLLAAGAKGHRAALPSATIMLKQNISAFRGQASELEILRQEVRNTKKQLVDILAECTGKGADVVEADMSHPKYFTPYTAVEYGLIDKVLEQQGATFTRASERKVLLPNGSKAS